METGEKRVMLKSDQEPAIIKLKNVVKTESGNELAFEESPVGESKSLGRINAQIQILQGLTSNNPPSYIQNDML